MLEARFMAIMARSKRIDVGLSKCPPPPEGCNGIEVLTGELQCATLARARAAPYDPRDHADPVLH